MSKFGMYVKLARKLGWRWEDIDFVEYMCSAGELSRIEYYMLAKLLSGEIDEVVEQLEELEEVN